MKTAFIFKRNQLPANSTQWSVDNRKEKTWKRNWQGALGLDWRNIKKLKKYKALAILSHKVPKFLYLLYS